MRANREPNFDLSPGLKPHVSIHHSIDQPRPCPGHRIIRQQIARRHIVDPAVNAQSSSRNAKPHGRIGHQIVDLELHVRPLGRSQLLRLRNARRTNQRVRGPRIVDPARKVGIERVRIRNPLSPYPLAP